MPSLMGILLVVCLLLLGALTLFNRHLVRACTWFVLFALTVSFAWWWMGFPWLALIELLLGAVLTGAFLFHALGVGPAARRPQGMLARWHDHPPPRGRALMRLLPALAMLAMLGLALDDLAEGSGSAALWSGGLGLLGLGLWAFVLHRHLIRRLLGFNVIGTGIFLILISLTGEAERAAAHGLVITGLVVAMLGTALGALLIRRLEALEARHGRQHAAGGHAI
ncbi:NADH-quinone oxidoreductase subunit K [Billgrantia saliphila]|uniref:NADH-quinone oxidoreductase subunit K n=1 Tax=Billgrantia saliphila TaxID=1848458 RepID=UPI0018CC41E3|nr:NADH-quinone oxidoreductase subunit K [Halomonas saliphila]